MIFVTHSNVTLFALYAVQQWQAVKMISYISRFDYVNSIQLWLYLTLCNYATKTINVLSYHSLYNLLLNYMNTLFAILALTDYICITPTKAHGAAI